MVSFVKILTCRIATFAGVWAGVSAASFVYSDRLAKRLMREENQTCNQDE